MGKKLDWKWMSSSIVSEFASAAVWEYELEGMTIESEADSTLSSLINQLTSSHVRRSEQTMSDIFPARLFLRHDIP